MRALIVVVLASGVAHAQPAATVRGTIVERTTREPVAGAVVTAGSELAASGDDGAFELALPPGSYTLEVSADWLVPARVPVVVGDAPVDVVIEVDAAEVVTGEQIEVIDIAPTAPGETKVDAKLARSVPGGGDAAKVVQALPAVARPATGSSEIVVWGAAPRDTRVFVDGVPVPALYHLGGYRSAVGNDLVGAIELRPAAFSGDRGRAIGGVIDIRLADPATAPDWRVQADVLDGSVAGKVRTGPLTTAGAVRGSWLDRAVALIQDPRELAPNAPLPRWTDAQLVMRGAAGERTELSSWVLVADDHLDRTLASDDPATETVEAIEQQSVRAQVTVRRRTDAGMQQATLWGGRDENRYDLAVGLIGAHHRTRAWVGGVRGEQHTRAGEHATLVTGLDVDLERAWLDRTGSLTIPAREGDPRIFGQPPGDDVSADRWQATTLDAAGYALLDVRRGRLSASVGGRFDAWLLDASRLTPRVGTTPGIGTQQILYTPDPRGTVQLRVTDETVARVDAGRYHQARAASDTSAVFGTPTLALESAWHVTLGAQWKRAPFAIEAAAYARWLDDLVARDLAVTPPLAMTLTQLGTGRVAGVQVTARAVGWHGLAGWLSYTLSRSTRQDAPDRAERLFDADQTHGLIAVGGWERGAWTLGGRVRVSSGNPRTGVIGSFFDSRSGRFQPIRGPHNGERLPVFFAADLRGERRFPLTRVIRGAVYLEVQNLTGRANAEEIIYSADFAMRSYLTGLPLLAIAGVRIEG